MDWDWWHDVCNVAMHHHETNFMQDSMHNGLPAPPADSHPIEGNWRPCGDAKTKMHGYGDSPYCVNDESDDYKHVICGRPDMSWLKSVSKRWKGGRTACTDNSTGWQCIPFLRLEDGLQYHGSVMVDLHASDSSAHTFIKRMRNQFPSQVIIADSQQPVQRFEPKIESQCTNS
eukprot:GEMP01070052.1.p1 GENE.GEMP01070052.1~~GEMP01070052.1.p1  ORF type:complete len:173 (+),score=23.88 GEMP01070052.1:293-811(+)